MYGDIKFYNALCKYATRLSLVLINIHPYHLLNANMGWTAFSESYNIFSIRKMTGTLLTESRGEKHLVNILKGEGAEALQAASAELPTIAQVHEGSVAPPLSKTHPDASTFNPGRYAAPGKYGNNAS